MGGKKVRDGRCGGLMKLCRGFELSPEGNRFIPPQLAPLGRRKEFDSQLQ